MHQRSKPFAAIVEAIQFYPDCPLVQYLPNVGNDKSRVSSPGTTCAGK